MGGYFFLVRMDAQVYIIWTNSCAHTALKILFTTIKKLMCSYNPLQA